MVAYAEFADSDLLSITDFLREAREQVAALTLGGVLPVSEFERELAEFAAEAEAEAEAEAAKGSSSLEAVEEQVEALEPLEPADAEPQSTSAAYSNYDDIVPEAATFEPAQEEDATAESGGIGAVELESPGVLAAAEAEFDFSDEMVELDEPAATGQFASEQFEVVDEFAGFEDFVMAEKIVGGEEFRAAETFVGSGESLLTEEPFADETAEAEAAEAAATSETASEPVLVAIGDEYYGMSLAELEALTNPDAAPEASVEEQTTQSLPDEDSAPFGELPVSAGIAEFEMSEAEIAALEAGAFTGEALEVEAFAESDGFADLPMIADVPAWAGAGEQASDAEPLLEESFEIEIEATGPVEILAEAEPAEVAAEAEPEEADSRGSRASRAEPEFRSGRARAGRRRSGDRDRGQADFEEEAFEDESPVEAAAQEAQAVEEAEVVHAVRPNVPIAQDPTDPDADLDLTDLDTELLDLFLEESNDILDHSDGMLAQLRDQSEDRETIVDLQRDLHTLKGGARMAGIYGRRRTRPRHGIAARSRWPKAAASSVAIGVVVLERGFDRLHGMVARVGERKAIALPAGLIAQVEALSQGQSLDTLRQASRGDSRRRRRRKPRVRAEAATLKPLSAPLDELGAEDEMTGVRAPQEQVRIRADLLDRLVNYAGEVAIYRARLEQQLGAFRGNLGELDQTTTRLREQLRRLDIETEAQIIARYQREGEANDETLRSAGTRPVHQPAAADPRA